MRAAAAGTASASSAGGASAAAAAGTASDDDDDASSKPGSEGAGSPEDPAAAALVPLSAIEDGNANDISADAVAIPPAAGDLEAAHALSEPLPDILVKNRRVGRSYLNDHILHLMDLPLDLQGAGEDLYYK